MKFTGHERDFNTTNYQENTNYDDYMHARYRDPTSTRFLSVDPVIDFEIAMRDPQGWNRYTYVRNNPLKLTDPTGKCYDPGGEGTRICIEAFIKMATFGGFRGDARGPNPNGGSYRIAQFLNLTTGGHGVTKETLKPGTSRLGPIGHDAYVAQHEVTTSSEGVRVQTKASDGLLFGAALNLSYDFTLKPTDSGKFDVTGSHSAFPSFEVWQYQDNKPPEQIFNYDAQALTFMQGVKDIMDTVTINWITISPLQ